MKLNEALAISVIVLFLFNSAGYYLLFELNKHAARHEMTIAIQQHPEKLTVLTINDVTTNIEFQWIHKNEFRYKGEMYDVVHEIKTGLKTVFICKHDTRESRLFAGLKRVNQNKANMALWEQPVMIFQSESGIDLSSLRSGSLIFPFIIILLPSSTLSAWSPPPEYS